MKNNNGLTVEEVPKAKRKLVALLILSNILLLGAGMYIGNNFMPEKTNTIYVPVEGAPVTASISFGGGYINDTIWIDFWDEAMFPPSHYLLGPAYNENETFILVIAISLIDRHDANYNMSIDISNITTEDITLCGMRALAYNFTDSSIYYDYIYHLPAQVEARNYTELVFFGYGYFIELVGVAVMQHITITIES